jgi:exopolyphosphatase/guanosine-5'-triphosphate,3'-diphosphate pyrophosphatase
LKLAAIDIGSNAARLLIHDVIMTPKGKPEFVKLSLVRVPLRLGFDVFENGNHFGRKSREICHHHQGIQAPA